MSRHCFQLFAHKSRCSSTLRIITVLMLAAIGSYSMAQQSSASLNGEVHDASGAVVPAVTLTLINTATSVQRTTKTNDSGLYVLGNVQPGPYSLSASRDGFETVKRSGIILAVNQTLTLNFDLKIGTNTQSIEVDTSAAQLEASTAELGTVIGTHTVVDLPLNGRQFSQLLLLTPGASRLNTAQNSGGGSATTLGGNYFPAMHGQSNRSNYFMLDGINDNEDVFATFAISPTVDDIQEFKVQAHNDQAQYGGVLGGVINVVTKSGGNGLHGAAWEFNRNSVFGATNPISRVKLPLNQNQYGGNIGGPVVIPHLYNGKNKTFFFGSYEGFRRDSSAAGSVKLTATPAQLNGDFSGINQQIYNPYTKTKVPGNIINPSDFDPSMVAYAKLLFAAPNTSGANGNLIDNTPSRQRQNQWSARIDHTISPHDSIWFRYTSMAQTLQNSGGFPGLQNNTSINATNYGFNYLHTFNSTTTLDLQFGRNLIGNRQFTHFTEGDSSDILDQIHYPRDFACGYGAQGGGQDCLVPIMDVTGYASGGEIVSNSSPLSSVYQWNGDFSKVIGRHVIQAGASFQRASFHIEGLQSYINFIGAQTGRATGDSSNPASSGNALASFLYGVPDNAYKRATVAPVNGQKFIGGYVQDQWKVTPLLTLNMGLRYDVTLWPIYGSDENLSNAIGEIDFKNGTYILQRDVPDCAVSNAAPCIPGGLTSVPNVYVSPDGHLWRNSYDNIQPRFGFGYQVTSRDVINGAFGLFFDGWAGVRQTVQGIGGDWPSIAHNFGNNLNPVTTTPSVKPENPLNGISALPAANPFSQSAHYRDPNAKNGYSEQWNVGVQHLFNSATVLEVNYVGSHSSRLTVGGGLYNVARFPGPGTPAQVAARRPFPYISPSQYDQSNGYSSYNGLEARLQETMKHGLQYIISYTYSKTMNMGCDGYFGKESCSIQDPYNIQNDRSVAGFDLTNNFSAAVTYDLPIGRGRHVDIQNRALDLVAGGWQINTIYAFTSGQPYNLTLSGDIANTGNSGYRLNKIGDPHLDNPTRQKWFNTAAFTQPAQYTFGTEGRNDLRADPFHNVDFSLFKTFAITERFRTQFRAETFNALNHITYGVPNNNISTSSTFGTVSSTRSTERQMQLAVKVMF